MPSIPLRRRSKAPETPDASQPPPTPSQAKQAVRESETPPPVYPAMLVDGVVWPIVCDGKAHQITPDGRFVDGKRWLVAGVDGKPVNPAPSLWSDFAAWLTAQLR